MLPNVSASRARGHRQVTPESSHRPRKAGGKALHCFNGVNVRPTHQEAPQSGPAREGLPFTPKDPWRAGRFMVTVHRDQ